MRNFLEYKSRCTQSPKTSEQIYYEKLKPTVSDDMGNYFGTLDDLDDMPDQAYYDEKSEGDCEEPLIARTESELIDLVVDLLKNHPVQWNCEAPFRELLHKSGIRLSFDGNKVNFQTPNNFKIESFWSRHRLNIAAGTLRKQLKKQKQNEEKVKHISTLHKKLEPFTTENQFINKL